jgi:type VI secretion system secreted protein VgrG
VTLEGGNITFACPGKFSVKGGKHLFDAGAATAAETAPLPTRLIPASADPANPPLAPAYDEQIVYKDSHGEPIAAMPARVLNKADVSQHLTGASPDDGAFDRLGTPAAQELEYALRYAEFKIRK